MNDFTESSQIIIVEANAEAQKNVATQLIHHGFRVKLFSEHATCLQKAPIVGTNWQAVVTSSNFAKASFEEFRQQIALCLPQLPVLQYDLTADISNLIKALAFAITSKTKVQPSAELVLSNGTNTDIIGQNPEFLKTLQLAKKVAKSSANILITGESGTGKEILARYIHRESKRRSGPFVAINCSAIPENLLESELFGHAKGSFTGALQKREGLFEEAENGTLFLDEIGDLDPSLQAKLLRVLQEKKIRRVGENQYRPVNCRIISATHKDLSTEIDEHRFREDLFFRLDVIPIHIPQLRSRPEDILPLAESFLQKYAQENDSPAQTFSTEVVKFLLDNPWRGNVRELENTIERATVLCNQSEVTLSDTLPLLPRMNRDAPERSTITNDTTFSVIFNGRLLPLDEVISRYIEFAVEMKGGARDRTAKELGIDRKTLYKRLKAHENESMVENF